MTYRISVHAISRFRERHPDAGELTDFEARHVLLAELDRAVAFGAQIGTGLDRLMLLPCGLVAAVEGDDDCLSVKTILTKELAIANMQAQGLLRNRSSAELLMSARLPSALCPDSFDAAAEDARLATAREKLLRSLADEHFRKAVGWKKRNEILRANGFDPAGEDGERYRAFFREARLSFYSELRNYNLRRNTAAG